MDGLCCVHGRGRDAEYPGCGEQDMSPVGMQQSVSHLDMQKHMQIIYDVHKATNGVDQLLSYRERQKQDPVSVLSLVHDLADLATVATESIYRQHN